MMRAGWLVALAMSVRAGIFGEAPELAARALSGDLPPVESRLPANPMIVQPVEGIGRYGGTLRMAVLGWSDLAWLDRTMGNESLVRWDPQWTQIIPNLAQSWTVNANATEYVFRLRSGVRWSDGAPLTADDIVFWYEEIFVPGIVRPAVPWFFADGKPVRVEKRDAFTVAFRYEAPNGILLQGLAGVQGDDPVSFPRHHLGRFHPRHNPEGLAALMAEAGETNWLRFFRAKIGAPPDGFPPNRFRVAELPRLGAWQLVPGHGYGRTNTIEAVRNPYYWKLDTAGNQLPYIDRLVYTHVVQEQELVDLALRGGIDLGERALTSHENLPRLLGREGDGGYRFIRVITDSGNLAAIALNLTHPDPERRRLHQNKDFRIGLSLAIDRDRIIREVLCRPGEPRQVAPRPESNLYDDRLARQYTEHDVELAGQHLDRAGLTARDADGWRLGPGGGRLTITALVSAAQSIRIAAMTRVREDWAAVGVDLDVRVEQSAVMTLARNNNRHDAMVWAGDGGLDVMMDARYYLPVSDESFFAVPWARWMINPADRRAEKPPPPVVEQMRLFHAAQAATDPAVKHALMRRVLDIAADQFPVIGLCTADDILCLVSDRLRNVPPVMQSSGRSFLAPAPVNPCQFWFDDPGGGGT